MAEINPEAQYRVHLKGLVKIGNTSVRPGDDLVVSGKRLLELPVEKIEKAELVAK